MVESMFRGQKMKQKISSHSFLPLISIFLALFLWPTLGFCDANDGTINLGPASGDFSVRFLSNIFGVVDGVLHGSGSQIFGRMFGVFNSAVLTLGMTILGYTLFVSTLRTAHEGEVLGRNWSSVWIPFKSAAGFALILPKASGYCIIQILTMWVVVQGVGAANLIWNAALDYLKEGGAIIQPNQPSRQGSVGLAGDILRAETCMFMIEQSLADQQKAQSATTPGASIPSFLDSVGNPTDKSQPDYKSTTDTSTLYFPGKLYNADGSPYMNQVFYKICGNVSWPAAGTKLNDPSKQQLADARSLAVLQVVMDLQPSAQQIARDYGPFPDAKRTILTTTLKGQNVLLDAGNDYEGIMSPAVNALNDYKQRMGFNDFVSEAKDRGWIMAGSYYQQLVTLNQSYLTDATTYPTVTFNFPADNENLPTSIKSNATALKTFFGSASPPASAFGASSSASTLLTYIQAQGAQAQANAKEASPFAYGYGKVAIEGVAGQIAAIFTGGISSIVIGYGTLISQTGDVGTSVLNPVTLAATIGSGMVSLVASIWLMGAATVFGVTALASICPAANPLPSAITSAMSWFVPLLTATLVGMFIMGATLAYYVPLIPYILFLFGGMGWLIGVIESIAAAPLVALGIAYPEEHEILGKAQPAVMLLTNIFIRPSLMVIGFIAGISLSYVGVWLLNLGFKNSLVALTAGAQGLAWVFMPIAILSIYTLLVVQILNQAFSLIHVLPDEVLRWVGGGNKQFGEARGEEAVKGGFKDDMGSVGKGLAGSTGEAEKTKNEKAEALEVAEDTTPGDDDNTPGVGGGDGGSG
jgi:defect in organelle trafficking protein DotA